MTLYRTPVALEGPSDFAVLSFDHPLTDEQRDLIRSDIMSRYEGWRNIGMVVLGEVKVERIPTLSEIIRRMDYHIAKLRPLTNPRTLIYIS